MNESPGVGDVIQAFAQALCGFVILATALPLVFPRAKAWWIRIFDFPRLQLAVMGAAGAALSAAVQGALDWPAILLPALSGAAVLYQAIRIWRYTPLAPREVQRSERMDPANRISLVLSNVLQDNRDSARVLGAIRDAN